jgi:hypothetical protein
LHVHSVELGEEPSYPQLAGKMNLEKHRLALSN